MKKQKLNKRRYLGPLCKYKHRYVWHSDVSSNQSVRYKSCNACCVCSAISVELRKKQQKKYRDTHKKKMQKYQKSYHKAHGKNYRSDYHRNYYLKVTKPKRHNKNFDKFMMEITKKLATVLDIPIELLEKEYEKNKKSRRER